MTPRTVYPNDGGLIIISPIRICTEFAMTLGEYGENDGEDNGELICRENISRHKPFGNTCFYLRGQATPSRSPSGVVQGQYVGVLTTNLQHV